MNKIILIISSGIFVVMGHVDIAIWIVLMSIFSAITESNAKAAGGV